MTDTHFEATPWLEVCRLKEGGFVAFELCSFGEKRMPVFGCENIDQLTNFIGRRLDPDEFERRDQSAMSEALSALGGNQQKKG